MGHLTLLFAGDEPFERHSSFAHHFSRFTRPFDSLESASISRPLWSAASTSSVARPQRISSNFAPKATQPSSRSDGATARQEARVRMEVHR